MDYLSSLQGTCHKEVASLTQTSDNKAVESKSEDNKELTIDERIERIKREKEKFLDTFYGERTTLKLREIETLAWVRAPRSPKSDSVEESLKALEDINKEMAECVPEKFRVKIDPTKDIEDQRIPDYTLTIDNKDGKATYNPFNKPPLRLE